MSEYEFVNADGLGDFGYAGNWVDVTSPGTPGPPGPNDVALVQAAGSITGSGNVAALDLIASGGVLTAEQLSIISNSMALTGTLNFLSGTQFIITDDVAQVGTSTIVQSNGSYMGMSGDDGTSGDVVTAMTFGQNSSDKIAYTVTGLGTLLDAGDGNVMIGGGGVATVTVSNGGTLETDDGNADGSGTVTLGGATGATGTLVVTGAYSTLNLAGILNVGGTGTGHFTLSGGADAELAQVYNAANGTTAMIVGESAGSTGNALITGAGTRLGGLLNSVVVVGDSGTGSMTISVGATANFGELGVGVAATGSVIVTGPGSLLELHDLAVVGDGASGTLQILAGAHMGMVGNESDSLAVGDLAGATGKLIVSGAGSTVSADNDQVQIGYYGTASAIISSGGTINSGAPTSSPSNTATFVGIEAGAVGTVTVENANSTWTAHGDFDVGYYGKGTLLVEGGGTVSSGNYSAGVGFIAGNEEGASGTVTVTGAGSKLTDSGRFVVGSYGTGALTISAGGVVTTTKPAGSTVDGAVIGGYSGGTGHVAVTGTGSAWSISSDLVVGAAGTGALTIGAGSTVTAASLLMAITGAGSLTVSGASAKLTVTGNAVLGNSGSASVSIGSGGLVSAGGTAEIKHGHVALSGGELSVTTTLTVDAGQVLSGYGTVQASSIINAATVQSTGGTLSFIGGVTGTGKFQILAGSTLSLGSSVAPGQQTVFSSATSNLVLGAPASFAGTLYDFIKGDTIDLSNVIASSLTYSGQTLTVHESGGASLALKFAGTYTQSSFGIASDGHSGTFITHT